MYVMCDYVTTADLDVCTVVRGCWAIQSVLILHIPIMLTYTWTEYAHLYMYIQYVIMFSNSYTYVTRRVLCLRTRHMCLE